MTELPVWENDKQIFKTLLLIGYTIAITIDVLLFANILPCNFSVELTVMFSLLLPYMAAAGCIIALHCVFLYWKKLSFINFLFMLLFFGIVILAFCFMFGWLLAPLAWLEN